MSRTSLPARLRSVSLAVFTELPPAEETEQDQEHTCETLLMCIVTVLSHGLRSGGGVGDVLRKPSKEVAVSPGRGGRGLGGRWAHSPGAAVQTEATWEGRERGRRDVWPAPKGSFPPCSSLWHHARDQPPSHT